MSLFLIVAAILPVIFLGMYIYKKDTNKEPRGMLAKLFFMGVAICIPVIIVELILGIFFRGRRRRFIYLYFYI